MLKKNKCLLICLSFIIHHSIGLNAAGYNPIYSNSLCDAASLPGTAALDACKAFLNNGVSIETRNNCDETALTIACKNNNAPLVQFLLEKGANPNATGRFSWPAIAMVRMDTQCFYALVQAGANIYVRFFDGALMRNLIDNLIMADFINLDIVHYLLSQGLHPSSNSLPTLRYRIQKFGQYLVVLNLKTQETIDELLNLCTDVNVGIEILCNLLEEEAIKKLHRCSPQDWCDFGKGYQIYCADLPAGTEIAKDICYIAREPNINSFRAHFVKYNLYNKTTPGKTTTKLQKEEDDSNNNAQPTNQTATEATQPLNDNSKNMTPAPTIDTVDHVAGHNNVYENNIDDNQQTSIFSYNNFHPMNTHRINQRSATTRNSTTDTRDTRDTRNTRDNRNTKAA